MVKKIELTASETAALRLADPMLRTLTAWEDENRFYVGDELLETIKDFVALLAGDAFQPWDRPRWKLLVELDKVVARMNKEATGNTVWAPGTLSPGIRTEIRQVVELLKELEHPAPAPEPEKRPLESLAELQSAKVGVSQICKIFGWVDRHGNPDAEKYSAACRGELDPPKYRTIQPVDPNMPSYQPHAGLVQWWSHNHLRERGMDHEGLVALVEEITSRADLVQIDDHANDTANADDNPPAEHRQAAEPVKRGRGRPRKDVALAVRR